MREGGDRPEPARTEPTAVRVGVLGPLTVEADGHEVHVAGTHRRRLLALLASRPGRMVSVDAIVDALWAEDPPSTAAKTVQTHVVRLRRSLSAIDTELIETVPGGYRLAVDAEAVDAVRFERLAADGRRELTRGAAGSAAGLLAEALGLWHGSAYAEFGDAEFAAAARVRLEELRLRATEDLAEAQLAGGSVAVPIPELERLVVEEPGRERAWALLMRALYAAGRQHQALVTYQRARRTLAESFGLDPGPELRALERQILDQDPELIVVSERPALPAALRATGPLVGRRAELAWLADAWDAARRGTGQVRVVLGPADGGRTRLAAELAARVIDDDGWVEYVRGGGDLGDLTPRATDSAAEPVPPGAVVDAVADRCRRGPLLLVVDDLEWMSPAGIATVEAIAGAAERLSLLLLLVADPAAGGAAIGAVRRLPAAATTTLGPLPDEDLARIVLADGVAEDSVAATVAVAAGLPGVARREAAAWAERAASDRLQVAAVSSLGASAAADEARATMFDDVLALVAARARRDELVTASLAGRHPYRALAAYGPEDADLFVGRERLVAELAARVLDRRLVAVVGASGSGKSSLVRAGLLPLVRSGRLPGKGAWRATVIVPGDGSLTTIENVADLDEPGPQLLIVDQFEEAIAAGNAEAFAMRLIDLVLDAALDIHVVLVVRADQYAALTTIRPLAALVEDAQVLVGPPTDDELRRIVEVPARRTGCVVERALTDLVLAEVTNYDAALPLVSAALADVWERRDGDTLTAERYVDIGGIAAAVERLGERAVEQAGDADGVRQVMMRLVAVTDDGQWVRRRLAVEEMPSELAAAVDALVDARLVQRDDREVDVVHEVVFRAWPRLAAWLEEARADLVLDRELRAAARVWDAQGRSDDDVYRGARLAAAAEFAARAPTPSPVVDEFVAAGRRVADREHEEVRRRLEREARARRRLTRALIAVAVLLAAALAAGVLAFVNERRADRQRGNAAEAAQLAESRQRDAEAAQAAAEEERAQAQVGRLVAESERELDSHLDLALLLAVEARRRDATPDTDGALLTALTHNMTTERTGSGAPDRTHSSFVGFLAGPPRIQYDVDISADGRIVASGGAGESSRTGAALVFDTDTRKQIARVDADSVIVELDVSPDGRYLLTRDLGNDLQLLDVRAGSAEPVPVPGSAEPTTALFRPGHEQFVVNTNDGVLTLWDIATMAPLDVPLPPSPLGLASFADDGTLAVGAPTGAFWWDIERRAAVRRVDLELPGGVPVEFATSPDGRLLAGILPDGKIHVWDLRKGELRGDPNRRPDSARGIVFSQQSPRLMVIGSSGGGVAFYDVGSERVVGEPLRGHGAGMRDLALSGDGRFLVTIADDGLIGLWGPNDQGSPISATIRGGAASNPSYSAGGRRVALRVGDHIEVRDGRRPAAPGVRVRYPPGSWPDASYQLSADGTRLLVFSADFNVAFVADAATGEPTWVSTPDSFTPEFASISPDGHIVATVDATYSMIRITDIRTGAHVAEVRMKDVAPELDPGVSGRPLFSSDGRYLDVPTNLGVARLDATDLRTVRFVAAEQNVQGVRDVPNTSHVIGVGVGGQVWRWDMNTGELVVRGRSRDSSSLTNIAVSPDGTMIAGYHPFSAQLALFDAETLRPIGEPFRVGDVWFTPQFIAGGRVLVGNGLFNDVTRWDVDPGSWQAAACLAAGRNLTRAEWREYLGDEPYRPTCPNWPEGD
jgi:DNA-binding SARP family transcriptional activator/WD40 repeat protein